MKSYMNGAMFALLALATSAVKIAQEKEVEVSADASRQFQIDLEASITLETNKVIEEDGVLEPDWEGGFSDEEVDCGCKCRDCPYDNIVNLPPDLFKDPRVTYEAAIAAEKLEPLVVDMVLDWEEILAIDPEELDSQILLPMFEDALEDQMRHNPELRDAIPDKPSHLQEQVDMVLEALRGMDGMGFDKIDGPAEGVERHSLVHGAGWVDSYKQWEDVQLFTEITPGVFFFSSEHNADAANEFEGQWRDLQKTSGAAYFRVDVEVGSVGWDIAETFGVRNTPFFLVYHHNEVIIESDGSDWAHFRSTLARHLKGLDHIDTEKETRVVTHAHDELHAEGEKVDESRIKPDAVYDGYEWDEDFRGDYELEKTNE